MSWIRLDDQIAHHPKFTKAGLSAWLWVCCIGFSQKFLTDGFIPYEAVGSIAGGIERPRNHIDKLVKVGLLERVKDGYQIHDYLEFNDSASMVRSKRETDRVRKESERNPKGIRPESERIPESVLARAPASHPIPSHPIPNLKQQAKEKEPGSSNGNGHDGSLSPAAPKFSNAGTDPFTDSEITQRAGAFIDRYQELYPQHRKGARYSVRPVRDYAAAVTLCQTWPDDRLDKLAVCFLTTDHKFAEEGSRTIPQFLGLASWCDGKLAEWEQGRK